MENAVFANVLAALTIVPLIVTWASEGITAIRSMTRRRAIEAVILLAGLLAISATVFDSALGSDGPLVLLYLPLPFLLWGALRFGTVGASTSFALVAFLVIWGAGHSMGPLGARSPAENALSVQLFLIFVGPLLLCLAALSGERESAQRLLRSSEQRFATAFRSSPIAMSIARQTDGRIIEVNDRWELLFGYRRGDALGRSIVDVGRIHPDAADEIRSLASTQGSIPHVEVDIANKEGEIRHLVIAGVTVEMGGEPCFIANFTDVTERRRTEELNQKLAHASRLTAMGELTASIAHEINQPMSAILSNVDAAEMLLDSGKAHDAELRQILEDIRSDDLRAAEVIRHVRGLAKKQQIEVEPIDLNDLISAVLRLVAPVAQRRNVTMSASFGELSHVTGDRVYVQQILLNLLFNAMDALAEALDHRRTLAVSTTSHPGKVLVAVRDHGHGIAQDRLEMIFDSFFTTKKDGMGLGLSIARTLVEALGGKIWAENNADGGATLCFTLPVGASGS